MCTMTITITTTTTTIIIIISIISSINAVGRRTSGRPAHNKHNDSGIAVATTTAQY